jgi:hypothetical protein
MPALRRYVLKRIVILAGAAGAILSLCSAVFICNALAQEIRQQIAGAPGEDLQLRLELPAQPDQDGADGAGFIRILGLPPSFSLNRGFAAVGAWAVSTRDLSGLTLTAPGDFEGNLLLTIELVRDQNAEPLRWQVQIALAQKRPAGSPPPPAMATMAPASPGSPPKPPESIGSMKAAQPLRAASRAQMNRARELLQNNDVAAARLIFKRLAETGLAEAAFNLAQTYDPDFLKTILTAGLEPDPALARQWYERAAAMGDAAAASRVSELNAR